MRSQRKFEPFVIHYIFFFRVQWCQGRDDEWSDVENRDGGDKRLTLEAVQPLDGGRLDRIRIMRKTF